MSASIDCMKSFTFTKNNQINSKLLTCTYTAILIFRSAHLTKQKKRFLGMVWWLPYCRGLEVLESKKDEKELLYLKQ